MSFSLPFPLLSLNILSGSDVCDVIWFTGTTDPLELICERGYVGCGERRSVDTGDGRGWDRLDEGPASCCCCKACWLDWDKDVSE